MTFQTRLALLCALGACTPQRPAGAYDPVYGKPCRPGYCDEDAGADESIDIPEPDAGEELDAGHLMVDPQDPLIGLSGPYLMRIDYYSTADESDGINRLRLKNRVSNLFLTELTPVDGKLRARERMCFQASEHKCLDGCDGWQTVYGPKLPAMYKQLAPFERMYTVTSNADGTHQLTAEPALMPLGYTDPAPRGETLPTNKSDPRVWQLVPNVTESARGMQTTLVGTLKAGLLRPSLDCELNSVMLFGTAFQTQLARLDADALSERRPQISTAGSKANVIYVNGTPPQVCTESQLAGRSGGDSIGLVRFMKTDLRACPGTAEEFEQLFPISAAEQANLDPPAFTDAPP